MTSPPSFLAWMIPALLWMGWQAPVSAGQFSDPRPVPQGQIEAPITPSPPPAYILFSSGTSELSDKDKNTLRDHASGLRKDARRTVCLLAHTERVGSREYSVALANKRITIIEGALRALGVRPRQIRKTGCGDERRIPAACPAEGCRDTLWKVELRFGR